jgi:hypothetical protein
MSRIVLTGTAAPSKPAVGKITHYADTDERPRTINGDGVDSSVGGGRFNRIRNSGFWFAQRQAPATLTTYSSAAAPNATRVITADGWGVTNENASVQYRRVDTSGGIEAGLLSRYYGEFTKITSNGKIIVSQVLEGTVCESLRGRTVRIQAKLKHILGTGTWRMGVLYLTTAGTVDSLPTTFVSAFGGTGTDPTWGTNLSTKAPDVGTLGDGGTIVSPCVQANLTTSWARVGCVATIPTSAKNIVIVVFSDAQVTTTQGLGISEVSITDDASIVDWQPDDLPNELARCQRFYQKTFKVDDNPVANAGNTTGALQCMVGKAGATALAGWFQWRFNPPMGGNAAPTITMLNPGAAGAQARRISGAASADQTATAVNYNLSTNVDISFTGDAGGTVGDRVVLHATADTEL